MTRSTFWEKQLLCPVCSTKVIVQKVRQGSYEIEKRDADFCVWYKGVNPVLYSVHVCPSCNYASTAEDFDKLDRRTAQRFQSEYKKGSGSDEFSGLMSPELAIKAHLLAIDAFRKIPGNEGKIAGLYLRVAWIYRQQGDAETEAKYLQMSMESYKAAFESARKLPEKLGEIGVAYLIGEISRRLGDTKEAIRWFNVALSNKGIKMRPDLEKLARAQWQATREGYQEEHKIASMGVPFGKLALSPEQLKEISAYLPKYSAGDHGALKEFETAFAGHAGAKFAIAFGHRYFCYESLIDALGIKNGDEAIVPAFSPINLINVLNRSGLIVRIADIHVDSLTISMESLKKALSANTKVVFIERFAGNGADLKAVKKLTGAQVPVVQLAYESLCARRLADQADFTVCDLAQLSTISALMGAVIVTDNEDAVVKIKEYMNHPSVAEYSFNGLSSGSKFTGHDYHLNALNAKIGAFLTKDFEKSIEKMSKIYEAYNLAFEKIAKEGKVDIMSGDDSYGCFALKLKSEEIVDNIISKAKEAHIYIEKMPQPAANYLKLAADNTPNARQIYGKMILLPAFPSMTQMDVERIASLVINGIG